MTEYSIGQATVPLLRGVVYRDVHPTAWEALLSIPTQVSDHVAAIGLALIIDESEGYAYLGQLPADSDEDVPSVVSRRQLSYRVSLLLALLRGKLLELDAQGDETRLVLSRDEVVDLTRTFQPNREYDARMVKDVEADLNKAIELGFVRRLRDQHHMFEVRRIIKAFIDAQWLADFDAKLAEYLDDGQQSTDSSVEVRAAGAPGGGTAVVNHGEDNAGRKNQGEGDSR